MKNNFKYYYSLVTENKTVQPEDGVQSVYNQGVNCTEPESCTDASATFVYYMNTNGKTVKEGKKNNWKDGNSGEWVLAKVQVKNKQNENKPYTHNVAYHPRHMEVVDLTLSQFPDYKTQKVHWGLGDYLSYVGATKIEKERLNVSDALQTVETN